MRLIKIGNITISEESGPFVIAEAGVNYYEIAEKEKIELLAAAKKMVALAAESGADAIKFQIYKADKLASVYSPVYWDTTKEKTKSQYELFQKYDKFGDKEYEALAEYAKEKNIIFMATPFDEEAIELVDRLSPVFKIASVDITNFPFLSRIAKKNKPIFLSVGASTMDEIKEAVELIKKEGNNQLALLHCVLNYPTEYQNANLGRIKELIRAFPEYLIGYSDHTLPDENMLVLTGAVLLGAKIIEKHFTLDKTLIGNDHYHAMDPDDLKKFKKNLRFMKNIMVASADNQTEAQAIKYARRSLVASRDLPEGAIISAEDITAKRPGTGISPKFINDVIGKRAKRVIKNDEILQWDDLS